MLFTKGGILLKVYRKYGTSKILVVVFALMLVWGCARKSEQPDMLPAQMPQTEPTVIELEDSKLADALREDDLSEEDRSSLPWLPKRPPLGMQFVDAPELQTVYFEFDKYSLTAQARNILAQNAEWLKNHPGVSAQIQGHCDERGTLEYNEVLGENRAISTKKYLVNLGIDPDRLYTISYGETIPIDPGHTEEAWAKNRRAHFKIAR